MPKYSIYFSGDQKVQRLMSLLLLSIQYNSETLLSKHLNKFNSIVVNQR